MNQSFYHKLCITNILSGVAEGLSKFSHPSKVALIFAAQEDDSVSVFDPQNILRWHEPKLKEIFHDNQDEWRKGIKEKISGQPPGYMVSENDLALSGLISYGGSCKDFFYQMWLTDHHPDICSIHPTERWLEQAACLLVHDYNSRTAAINSTDYDIPDYAITAEFNGDHGFLKLGNEKIASFFDGSFHSTTREAKMVELEEILLDSDLDGEKTTVLFQLISHLVHSAGRGRHGCTLVIDLNESPVQLSGHVLEPSLSLLDPKNIKLACSLLKIDGAVHITSDLCINIQIH